MSSFNMLADFGEYFPHPWLQGLGLLVVIGLIIFWVQYRRRQM